MPAPIPVGALYEAYRVCCIRCLRAMKINGEHECVFSNSASKKCKYCTKQNALCIPLPWFLYEEFQKLQAAQRPEEVVTAAKAADNVMLLAASEAPKSQSALQFGMLEEARALREEVTTLRQRVEDGVAVQAKMLELMKAQLEALKRLAPAKGRGMKRAREVEDEGEGRGELTAPYGAEEALHVYVS